MAGKSTSGSRTTTQSDDVAAAQKRLEDEFYAQEVPMTDTTPVPGRSVKMLDVTDGIDATTLSFDDLVAALGDDVVDIKVLDPRIRFDKDELVNIPFVILKVRAVAGDYGQPFVVVDIKTATNDVGWFTDGSTGICQQLIELSRRNPDAKAVMVRKGLTRSEYATKDQNGNDITGVTFYLNTN